MYRRDTEQLAREKLPHWCLELHDMYKKAEEHNRTKKEEDKIASRKR